MNSENKTGIRGAVLIAAVISCFAAFINWYPLVYPDTGTYIDSGFRGNVPFDRPIFYGLFLRHISLASSLWYVIFAQGLLVCYILRLTLGIFFSGLKRDYIFLGSVTFLTLLTGFSYNVSILIPDIFSAITLLCLVNLLIHPSLSRLQTVFISVIFVYGSCTQLSSLPIFLILLVCISVYVLVKQPEHIPQKKLVLGFALLFSCFIIVPLANFGFSGEFRLSGGNHVFMMNHLIETGILKDYLEDNCAANKYVICNYQDQLGWDFIWSAESPLYKAGGVDANRLEYETIIADILTTPKYMVMLFQKSLENSLKQLFTFQTHVTAPQLSGSGPYGQIYWHYQHSLQEYISSRQNSEKLNITLINLTESVLILLSLVFLVVIMLVRSLSEKLSSGLRWMISLVLLYMLISCVVCSNLSTVDPRFQNRIVWLLPFCVVILIGSYLQQKKNEPKNV